MQVQQYLEGPIGMALYDWQDGKLGEVRMQGGERCQLLLMRLGNAAHSFLVAASAGR
jgi:hypothetical protein